MFIFQLVCWVKNSNSSSSSSPSSSSFSSIYSPTATDWSATKQKKTLSTADIYKWRISLSLSLPICLSVSSMKCLFIYLSMFLSVCLFCCLSRSACPAVCMPVYCLSSSIWLSVSLPLSICLSMFESPSVMSVLTQLSVFFLLPLLLNVGFSFPLSLSSSVWHHWLSWAQQGSVTEGWSRKMFSTPCSCENTFYRTDKQAEKLILKLKQTLH